MDYIKIGSYLQALRKTKGLTQAELAEYFQVSNKTISKWECGESLPEIPLLKALADFYDVTVDEILNGESKARKEITEEVHQKNQGYFVFRKIKNIKIINAIALSVLFLGLMLLYILGYTTTRSDIACFVSIAFYFVSLIVVLFGKILLKDYDTLEESAQVEIEKERKKWLKIYFFCLGGCAFLSVSYYLIPQIIALMRHVSFVIGVLNFGLFFLITIAVLGLLVLIYFATEKNEKSYKFFHMKFFHIMYRYHIVIWILLFSFLMCYFFSDFAWYKYKPDDIIHTNKPLPEVTIYFNNAFVELSYFYWIGVILLATSVILGIVLTIKKKTMISFDSLFMLSLIIFIVDITIYHKNREYYYYGVGAFPTDCLIFLIIMLIVLVCHIVFLVKGKKKQLKQVE